MSKFIRYEGWPALQKDDGTIALPGNPSFSNAIHAQEKAGQELVVNTTILPKEMGNRADYEALGVVFGPDYDDLFLHAALPAGWHKVGTDHDMWSEVADAEGNVRIKIFYKAAFYDRRAHMFIHRPSSES